ncbi:choice-of-anchor I family protein [Caldimonas manganoxidans]|uniref:choice-of-anchor I family protein n=1 Tax=Caldimonas manganoxidans TaxID=196015 RepID=UPI0003A13239|nr:choice-of-anchor I family protein [Caldimonas manganoxidans]
MKQKHKPWGMGGIVAVATALVVGCGGGSDGNSPDEPVVLTPTSLSMTRIGGYVHENPTSQPGAAEIPAYDPLSRRLFVVNATLGSVDVLDLSNPAAPTLVQTLDVSDLGASVNSVAIHNGVVALAIEANPKTDPGRVAFYRAADLQRIGQVTVGALPDMLTFTPDGRRLLVANEGEPNSYNQPDSVDPEGSISIIDLPVLTPTQATLTVTARTAGFAAFNNQAASLRAAGVRIYGPNATVAQDLEPEYIAVSDDGRTAYVTLQENNAIAIVDIETATVTSIRPLGFKDHSLAGMGMDVSDEDGGTHTNSGTPAVRIAPVPVRGLYLPDAIASYTVGGQTYLITANEGDARDWPGFNEETRVRAYCTNGLEPAIFGPDAANLLFDSHLGRLRITTTPNGGLDGKNSAGRCTELYAFGARSFSIWTADVRQVYDSGDEFEQRTAALAGTPGHDYAFNASNDNNTLDSRSPSKGPEPEGVVLGRFGAKTFAFIGLERVGGVMIYDVSDPAAPRFVTYLNTREGAGGDRGPEGLALIPAADSPHGQPLLIVGHETSGTTAVYQINLSY